MGRRIRHAQIDVVLSREPYDDGQPDDERDSQAGRHSSGDQGDEQNSLDDAHPGAGSGRRGGPGHVVRDDGAGYGKAERGGKTQALLTLRQFQHR
jgi:hypothetical protein